jgi:hypothetical protein
MLHVCLDSKGDGGAIRAPPDLPRSDEAGQEVNDLTRKKGVSTSESRFIFMGHVFIAEKKTVLQLKQQLFDSALLAAVRSPKNPHCLRLKDFKGGKLSGPLRDDRQLCKCLMVRETFFSISPSFSSSFFTSCRVFPMGGR